MKKFESLHPELFPESVTGTGPGWDLILSDMANKTKKLLKESENEDLSIKFIQIKEKFGTLRVYYHVENGNKEVWEKVSEIIKEAENRSCSICEICGAQGALIKGGWLKTLCPFHEKQKNVDPAKHMDDILNRM